MLLVATAAWALSFSLGKDAGARMNELVGAPAGTFFGPTVVQGARFTIAGVLWFLFIPAARRGWTKLSFWRGGYLGLLLGISIILQHLSLDLTTPAATAFLTALTVLWVPAIVAVASRKLPPYSLLLGVVIACPGLYLMLGEGLTSFRRGEMLGLACSITFAFHLLAVSRTTRQEGPWRMAGAQFLIAGLMALIPALWQQGMSPARVAPMLLDSQIAWRLVLLLLFPTFIAFGLMVVYQHKVDPTRAALIYQGEPALAAGFDYLVTGRTLSPIEFVGAAFILAANLIAELMPATKAEAKPQAETPGEQDPQTVKAL